METTLSILIADSQITEMSCTLGDVFETYAQNNTPGAYRIFWVYAKQKEIYILDITPHP